MTGLGDAGYALETREGRGVLLTESLAPGFRVYGEELVSVSGAECRVWDPHRSKLAAALMAGLEGAKMRRGSVVLYLGASTGTTVSHVSDIVGERGRVFAVEHSSRVARELLDRVASRRANVVPVLQDARAPREYAAVYGRADVVYADIAQPDQTQIAIDNCTAHLRPRGWLLLVIKARSIDVVRAPAAVIRGEVERLRRAFDVEQVVDLAPYDRDHALAAARMR